MHLGQEQKNPCYSHDFQGNTVYGRWTHVIP